MSNNIHHQHHWPNNNNNNNNNNGPCGACKYLRRKCVKGCIFAPYFDAEQGTIHFAAVHKVFGASNASKLLLKIPVNRRVDAVVTLCYEALSRVRDPVYGCVSHLFSLQQQVLNMQSELASVQARLSTLQHPTPTFPTVNNTPQALFNQISSSSSSTTTITTTCSMPSVDNVSHYYSQPMTSTFASAAAEFNGLTDNHHDDMFMEDDDLQTLTREFVTRYLPGVKLKSEPS